MIWTPKALIEAAKCLVHFEQKDARAWQALAYRIAPGIDVGGLNHGEKGGDMGGKAAVKWLGYAPG